jgi:hypothetical protein
MPSTITGHKPPLIKGASTIFSKVSQVVGIYPAVYCGGRNY